MPFSSRNLREDWIKRGDRSHANLVLLDSLHLSYPRWQEDVNEAEESHMSMPMEFQDKIFEIREKQRMHDGDRSHPRLVTLDSLVLSYPNWEADVRKAEEYHLSLKELFSGKIEGMREKQKIYEGDRSHSNLVLLDNLNVNYHGSESDIMEAEEIHTSKPFMFPDKLHEIREKQRMFEKDRSHPRLVALDQLKLTYPDWERDKIKAEDYHVRIPDLFMSKLMGMKEKQKMHEGDRSHPNLQTLDKLKKKLTFPGWQVDFFKAEESHTHMPLEFDRRLFEIAEKQKIFQGDRNHPRLILLDSLHLSYPHWQRDFAKAQDYHIRYSELFEGKMMGMKEKQRIYAGNLQNNSSTSTQNQQSSCWGYMSDIFSHKKSKIKSSPSKIDTTPQGSGECIICLRSSKTHAFVPCGHLCICQDCVPMTMADKRCPICRQEVTQVIKVFFS